MEIFPLLQARLALYTFLTGLVAGTLFDLFWQIAGVLKKYTSVLSAIVVGIGDFITVTLTGGMTVVLCYYFNNGEVRLFCLVGLGVGLALYFFAFSPIIRRIMTFVFRLTLGILCKILLPILKISKFVYVNLQNVLYYIIKALAKMAVWVYNIYVKKYILKKSRKGFVRKRLR
jgi:hypothetical protein